MTQLYVPGHYETVSTILYTILDKVGLREDVRQERVDLWLKMEKLFSGLQKGNGYTVLFLGSQTEATTTLGCYSDIDLVYRQDAYTALQDRKPGQKTLLMVDAYDTPPGYVTLHFVEDFNQSPLLYNLETRDNWISKIVQCEGPADKVIISHQFSVDTVIAFESKVWPYQATEWITRHRRFNWPSPETVSLIHQMGMLLVPVGHRMSTERHLEWRISLSLGERLLVIQFNNTQYKCYVLLKMINKCFIERLLGKKVLSSYHMKTCMFYMVESTPLSLWQPENLLLCVDLCLRRLRVWVEGENCPNYFIPAENMFQCKAYGPIQGQLAGAICDLLRLESRFLIGIKYDDIGLKLALACQSPLGEVQHLNQYDVDSVRLTKESILTTMKDLWLNIFGNNVESKDSAVVQLLFCFNDIFSSAGTEGEMAISTHDLECYLGPDLASIIQDRGNLNIDQEDHLFMTLLPILMAFIPRNSSPFT